MTNVLVIDDETPILEILETNLTARGYRVTTAGTGLDALVQNRTARPDAVILDLGLPDMDGVAVIKAIRAAGAVPIIVLSARTDGTEKVAALDAGANDYVTKPFEMDELIARLRVAVRTAPERDERSGATGDYLMDLALRRIQRGW